MGFINIKKQVAWGCETVIVSKKHNFLFLHVPKTGGTMAQDLFNMVIEGDESYLSVIGSTRLTRKGGDLAIGLDDEEVARMIRLHGKQGSNYEMQDLSIPAFLEQIVRRTGEARRTLHKHSNVKQVKAFFSKQFYETCAKVIMVRNPYSRAWSAYKYSLRTEGDVPGSLMRKGERIITFEEFLDEGRCIKTKAGRCQVDWYDADAENFHVFRLENFANSIRQIIRNIMKAPLEMVERVGHTYTLKEMRNVRTNASTSRMDEWKGMSPEARKRIERIYRADFETFGY